MKINSYSILCSAEDTDHIILLGVGHHALEAVAHALLGDAAGELLPRAGLTAVERHQGAA